MRSPFKIAAPWCPAYRPILMLVACADVGGQPLARKSRLRKFTLSLLVFNLRMQALRTKNSL
jgi:hypothetical protein